MRSKVMTARPAARKDSSESRQAKKTVAVASTRKSEPIIQQVERKSSRSIEELPKKAGELPVPTATFVF
jgi:hypothetical protein